MSLELPGFADPVGDSQAAFRAVLEAMSRPGRIVEDRRVEFPRPRLPELLTAPEFVALKRHCLQLLHRGEAEVPLPRVTPLGAAVVAGTAVALLVLGYLAIYLLVFLPRGPVG